ncbi:scavenger receptor cysteine-rich type 1 protein M130-like [Anneissia japonica]|uniref:scavenger receptor cysteine-rich type 1 protein M130-like n=1 Tax=Anneissia japonica TaxID=1529436 RepID=UPI00142588EE|nr:scavenger receptor cysteine-rich type 1 protein M130-like [Anneissia japonica]
MNFGRKSARHVLVFTAAVHLVLCWRHACSATVDEGYTKLGNSVSLIQGTTSLNGYLMIRTNDFGWLPICKSNWASHYSKNAKVACRQLQLGLPKGSLFWNSSLEASVAPEFVCSGHEVCLQNCQYDEATIGNCSKDGQLWLECSGFEEIKLRLAMREKVEQGRVEIYHNGRWGTICDRDWTISDANIVCKTFLGTHAIDVYKSTQDDHEDGHPIFISDITCTGKEDTILDCSFNGLEDVHDCSHIDEVWVDCETNVVIAGGQNMSASWITALSMVVLTLLLVIEYLGLRRYQRWKADRRARRQNMHVRFQRLLPGRPHDTQDDQISIRGAGVESPAHRTRFLLNDGQPVAPNNSILINTNPSQVMEEPPPPYSSTPILQNGMNVLNENSGTTSVELQQQESGFSSVT